LTPMATIVEADTVKELSDLIPKCYEALEKMGCGRVYGVIKFDIRPGRKNRLKQKIESVKKHIEL